MTDLADVRSTVRQKARGALSLLRVQVGMLLAGGMLFLAIVGPLIAPNDPTTFVAPPFAMPSGRLPFGAD